MKRCFRCGIDHPDSGRFCISCGTALEPADRTTDTCPNCSTPVDPETRSCPRCGPKARAVTEVYAPASAAPTNPATTVPAPTTPVAGMPPPATAQQTGSQRKPKPIVLVVLGAVVVLAVLLMAVLYFNGATVAVTTDPTDAVVEIDGRVALRNGSGAISVPHLRAGDHALTVKREGYADWNQTFSVGFFDRERTLQVQLVSLVNQNSPTAVYKTLFAAVKKKDTARIRAVMSKATMKFIEGTAAMQKKTVEEALANGLTESAMDATLPEICNERIEGNMGALEVKPSSGKWEDLPFVLEDGKWKFAVGEIFDGTYRSPGTRKCIPPPATPSPSSAPTKFL